jgi:hypothetical protein
MRAADQHSETLVPEDLLAVEGESAIELLERMLGARRVAQGSSGRGFRKLRCQRQLVAG